MNQWIIKLITASLLLTICTYLLPTQSLRKTAVIMFGFIFITILIEPAKMLARKDVIYEAKQFLSGKLASLDNQNGDAENMIFDEYKVRIQNAVTDYINNSSAAYCSHSMVYVNQDIESLEFGQVETVYCYVAPSKENDLIQEDDNEIHQIIIDINGVHFGTTEDIVNQDKKYLKELQKKVAEYLAINESLVHIMEISEE